MKNTLPSDKDLPDGAGDVLALLKKGRPLSPAQYTFSLSFSIPDTDGFDPHFNGAGVKLPVG